MNFCVEIHNLFQILLKKKADIVIINSGKNEEKMDKPLLSTERVDNVSISDVSYVCDVAKIRVT